jgi:2-iminobutanoate/2-iminopropanoate deaminase
MQTKLKTDVAYLTTDAMKDLPFSEAVRVGAMLYLSGKLGTDSSGKLVPGGIAAETRQTMENIKAALDMNEWDEMNKVYVTYFRNHLPARSAMGVNGLARGARVEIEVVAVVT